MLTRNTLGKQYKLNSPASREQLEEAEKQIAIPTQYKNFLTISNGLYTGEMLVLLGAEDLYTRNHNYEVQKCIPGYTMIGDDSGGIAILMDEEGRIYENDMGVMNHEFMQTSAASLEDLLINLKGKTISER